MGDHHLKNITKLKGKKKEKKKKTALHPILGKCFFWGIPQVGTLAKIPRIN